MTSAEAGSRLAPLDLRCHAIVCARPRLVTTAGLLFGGGVMPYLEENFV
jgi:hypothetical protein